MPYVTGGKYLDSPLSYGVRSTAWSQLYFLNRGHTPFTDAQWNDYYNGVPYYVEEAYIRYTMPDQGVVPYLVLSEFEQVNSVERYRYEYELDWATFPPSCRWTVGVGSWGGITYVSGNFEASFIPATGSGPFPEGYYQLLNQAQSWASVQSWLNYFSIPVLGGYPQQVSITVPLKVIYHVYEYRDGLTKSRTYQGDISFEQMKSINWAIYDYPQPAMVFDPAGCYVQPGHVHTGGSSVSLALAWHNSFVPDHQTYPYQLQVVGPAGVLLQSDGTSRVGSGQSGQSGGSWALTARQILGRDPAAGETFNITALMKQVTTGIETSRATIPISVQSLPPAEPTVLPDKCTCSKTAVQAVAPGEGVDFNIVIHRHTPDHDVYQTQTCYIGVACKGHTQVLWSGVFPANVTELTRTFRLSPNQLTGTEITSEQYIVPVFITGNGTVYDGTDASTYFVPNSGQGLAVQPLVGPQGHIHVHSSPNGMMFTVEGPANFGGITPYDQDWAYPAGSYRIHWGSMAGYVAPDDYTLTLGDGETITFNGTYREGGEEEPPGIGSNAGLALMAAAGLGMVALAIKRRNK